MTTQPTLDAKQLRTIRYCAVRFSAHCARIVHNSDAGRSDTKIAACAMAAAMILEDKIPELCCRDEYEMTLVQPLAHVATIVTSWVIQTEQNTWNRELLTSTIRRLLEIEDTG